MRWGERLGALIEVGGPPAEKRSRVLGGRGTLFGWGRGVQFDYLLEDEVHQLVAFELDALKVTPEGALRDRRSVDVVQGCDEALPPR